MFLALYLLFVRWAKDIWMIFINGVTIEASLLLALTN